MIGSFVYLKRSGKLLVHMQVVPFPQRSLQAHQAVDRRGVFQVFSEPVPGGQVLYARFLPAYRPGYAAAHVMKGSGQDLPGQLEPFLIVPVYAILTCMDTPVCHGVAGEPGAAVIAVIIIHMQRDAFL